MADNLDPVVDNQDPVTPEAPVAPVTPVPVSTPAFSWKTKLSNDLQGSPTLQKFEDTPDGLGKAIESHLSLEKLLGHEKVPLPKDANDKEGWTRFNKALGVPDTSDGYKLADVQIPEGMKGLTFDKSTFAKVAHQIHATPAQAEGLWSEYTKRTMQVYNTAVKAQQDAVNNAINALRSEWGDSYEANIDVGQMVINKFSDNQEMNDFLTASLVKDARGIKFLAKLGQQFAENKIGDFQSKQFAKSPAEAQKEIDLIRNDPKHPYNDIKAPHDIHNKAVEYVNALYEVVNRAKG